MKKTILYLLLFSLMAACSKDSYIMENDQVVVTTSGQDANPHTRLTVISDGIIKVEASATREFDTEKSLIATENYKKVDYDVEENDSEVIIKTAKLIVKVSKADGTVSYFDLDNQPIIAEKANGRSFEPITVDNTNGYTLRQQFDSPEDEALYGLGQHQADEINYKGKNEELFQYNTKVSIPFIVSTKKYGILWDNYSLTRFGDPRPYSNINTLKLYNKAEKAGGLTATYHDTKTNNTCIERDEEEIDYENLTTISKFPDCVDFNNAKITWEGYIEGNEEGLHRFLCYYAGYTKLWIDGELQFYKWRTAWNPSVAKFSVNLKPGEKKHIKLEWIPDGGVSYMGLKVLTPVDEENQKDLSFYSEMGQDIRYYFVYGDNMDEVISQYRTITGKAQVMPKWSMGFWQSRERYKTQEELLDVLHEFRDRHIPLDNIVLDWSYWPETKWGSHDFDLNRFPDAKAMVDEVHDNNAQIMISVWPKFYLETEHFKEFDENGWMYRTAIEDSVKDWIGSGYYGSFYDAYSEDARKLFWKQINNKLYTKGFDAWWLDATEPDVLSNASLEYRKDLMNPTALGPSTKYFNAFALMNAKGIYEGQRALENDERVFILTRSGFAGIQKYGAVTWSGDIGTRWEDMKAQISAGINFAMSGLPYWTMDIGGFCVEKRYERAQEGSEDLNEWRELNTRWFQFGAFAPLFRVHGQYPYREIFNIAPEDHPAYKSILKYNKLRYSLMPYIYSLAGWTYTKDYTIMRGLAMDFTDDAKVYNIGDQFMFGPSIMVAPVYEYKARKRDVYLPASKGWYNGNTGQFLEGGQKIIADAPYEDMPMFIKAGSILPFGPEIEYTTQKPADPITLVVYTGDDATFEIYEDEGTNYNYENGAFTEIPLTWSEAEKTLTIGARKGEFEGMLKDRTFRVVFASKANGVSLYDEKADYKEVKYDGTEQKVIME
ncbi:TIM-barrel domain-containing protein [Chondrinema litorale]|uniref:TIM-barrel domain-containing protein n=1 Tax=Chondrinema litorale TaxID=2994555 RepID=UPI002542D0E1|nr:TIM-barrel domain-containing protein [Chondrinema litorale]UZR99185.1 DUF5110 domain-containing protein [Chondrinema litorale]